MTDQPETVTLVYLRRLDANMTALREDMADLKQRFTTLEVQVGHLAATEASHYAQTALRLDRIEHRLERLGRHTDIIPA